MSQVDSLFATFGRAPLMAHVGRDIVYRARDVDPKTISAAVGDTMDEQRADGEVRRERRRTVTVLISLDEDATGGGVSEPKERSDWFDVDDVSYMVTAVVRHGSAAATLTGVVNERGRMPRPGER